MGESTLIDPGLEPVGADLRDRPTPSWDLGECSNGPPWVGLSDEELTAQALAAPVRTVADHDALSYWDVVAPRDLGLLPAWYMPTPSAGSRRLRGWRRRIAYLVTGSIVALNAAGLCITYGHVTLG